MKNLLYSAGLALFLSACNNSQSEENKIEVTGQATMKVVPDMVELSLRACNVKPVMRDAVAETQATVNQILAVCRKYMREETDIKVSNVSTDKSYTYQNGKQVFNGYEALQVLDVTLKDISKIEQFTEELLATRISKIDNIRYNHTKADSIMREVNLMALEDARQTAEKMCAKMDVSMGKVIYLSNYQAGTSNDQGVRYANSDYDVNMYNKGFGGRGFKMTAEILQFQNMAFAEFEIK